MNIILPSGSDNSPGPAPIQGCDTRGVCVCVCVCVCESECVHVHVCVYMHVHVHEGKQRKQLLTVCVSFFSSGRELIARCSISITHCVLSLHGGVDDNCSTKCEMFFPQELRSGGWTKKDKRQKAPNVVAFTQRFNHVSLYTLPLIAISMHNPRVNILSTIERVHVHVPVHSYI